MTAPTLDAWAAAQAQAGGRRGELADGLVTAYGLAWAAGAIHLTAVLEHVGEHPVHAVFFACLACAQLLWGLALYRSPTRGLLLAGAIASLAVVGLWIVSRTSGLPIGAGAWRPEPVGVLDLLASADEALLAVLVCLKLSLDSSGRALRYLTALGVLLVLLSTASLTHLGHAH